MRLGLVIGQLTAGGAEGQLWLLCRELQRRGEITPIVYCLSDRTEPYGPQIEATGVPVRVITGSRWARVRSLRHHLEADRIDVIHAWLFIANAYAWMANRRTGPPLVTSARNCKRQGRVLDYLNRRAFAASAAIVVNSHEVARYIAQTYNALAERTVVIYNAIDTARFHPAATRRADDLCVVMIGRLVPQKNPSLFIAAAAAVRQQIPGVRFRLIGDGPLRPDVEAAIRSAGLSDCCEVLGERRDVPELLRQADMLWLTSDWEGLPNVVLEAMASGLPVIATDVGGTRELLRDGEGGFVVPPGDRDALVARATTLLRDPAARRVAGEAARTRAEMFALAAMTAAMTDLYTRVGM